MVITLIMDAICQPGMCNLTLSSFYQSIDFVLFTSSFCDLVSSLLPYNLDSPYLVNTWIIEGTCQPDMCHLTMTSLSRIIDLYLSEVFMIKSVSPLTYSLGSVYLVNTFMICTCYLNLTSFSTDLAKYTNKTFTRFDYMSDTAGVLYYHKTKAHHIWSTLMMEGTVL